MDYGFKPTTNGRKVMIACLESGGGLELTRVAFGKGLIAEDAELANQHTLIDYVADGAISDRRHENDRLYLSAQYCNKEHPEIPTFYIREFMVYARDPDTGEETDLLYATLGDLPQAVPAYVRDMPAATFNFPLVTVLSDEINVSISAPAGLVTYAELTELVRQTDIIVPKNGWTPDADSAGRYAYHCDVAIDNVSARMIPQVTVLPDSFQTALACEFGSSAQTLTNAVRLYANKIPGADIRASLLLLANPPYVRSDGTSEVLTSDSVWNASPEELQNALGV